MKKIWTLFVLIQAGMNVLAQNVGIGTTNPVKTVPVCIRLTTHQLMMALILAHPGPTYIQR
jgi:hypothetical protein